MVTNKERKTGKESNNDYSNLKTLFLNCTIKPSPEVSHTRGLCDDVAKVYQDIIIPDRQGTQQCTIEPDLSQITQDEALTPPGCVKLR